MRTMHKRVKCTLKENYLKLNYLKATKYKIKLKEELKAETNWR